jgi:hypothetical protein
MEISLLTPPCPEVELFSFCSDFAVTFVRAWDSAESKITPQNEKEKLNETFISFPFQLYKPIHM